ncbi:MAG TPA: PBP1A family penicillin-binding protein [Desulfobacteria bacterium]|nr:PBP1A family penicillin-binding protein [Desulfobacteria bacterium]
MNKLVAMLRRLSKTIVAAVLFLSLVAGVLAINLLCESFRGLPSWNKQDFHPEPSASVIYDRYGKPITSLRGKVNRIPVSLDQVAPTMQEAIIAIEDERFFDHKGVDYWGLTRALYNDFKGISAQEGASTITQQLVKNVLLTPEKSLTRKIREAILAREVEATFNKREILELYLNTVYFGEGAYGVEAASRVYFNKSAGALDCGESALLAGLVQNPSRYSPYVNPKQTLKRRNTVLSVMQHNGYLSANQVHTAQLESLPAKRYLPEDNYPHPFYLDNVISELINRYGFSEQQVYDGGLRIFTTMDPTVQNAIEAVYANPANFPQSSDNTPVESAMVVVEQASGEVKGLIGGRKHVSRRGYNRATMLKRQPGSTAKPLVVYAPAIEKGYSPTTVLDSSVETYGAQEDTYAPENMGNVTWGRITMRKAIQDSVNTYAVKLLKLIGIEDGYNFGKRLGLKSLVSQDKVLGLALGGTTIGLSPLELASAYTPLANHGVKLDTHVINRVTDASGRLLLEVKALPQQVMKPMTAEIMTDLLKSVVERGTGKQARLPDRDVAGKTGTTQLPHLSAFNRVKRGNKDAWFAGYTSELTGVVWLGFDNTDSHHYLEQVYGGSYPAEIWQKVFSKITAAYPPFYFGSTINTIPPAEKNVTMPGPSKPQPRSKKRRIPSPVKTPVVDSKLPSQSTSTADDDQGEIAGQTHSKAAAQAHVGNSSRKAADKPSPQTGGKPTKKIGDKPAQNPDNKTASLKSRLAVIKNFFSSISNGK